MSSLRAQHDEIIHSILCDKFLMLPGSFEIEPVQHAQNGHVFFINLVQPFSKTINALNRLFTFPIPAKTFRLVLNIPRDDASLENSARVRNEVAFLSLARDALLLDQDPLFTRFLAGQMIFCFQVSLYPG
ncbi:hypothetical protein E4U55_004237 [Claviceps digitariae]|nr:hypothetical protein E4U55_004237 [Claviceps digitariae]